MLEKRKLKRRHLIYYLRVFENESDQILGYLVDITTEGLLLVSEEPIEINKTFKLRMELPVETSREYVKKQITIDAFSIRSDKDINPQFYITGFQMQNLDSKDAAIIEQLIRWFGFQD